ncbi:death domain-associated protein 6-like [Danaus plexippus]|uniref:death domain-associated protein 6-like n=1 Tax=Danaus plexippus TaxID=13037 RepID=UPI002AB136D4|nr:death domain-associated protein 6-like [Danaus plexippus]
MSIVPDNVNSSDTEDDCVLESVTYVDQKCLDKHNFEYVYEENSLFAKFIEKCYDVENSRGMSKVINKILLKCYNESNPSFKKSAYFRELIEKSIILIETEPKNKFTHISRICDTLRSYAIRKRIKPITLATNIGDNNNKQTLKRKSSPDNNCKRPKILVSESDDVVLTEESNKINNNIVNNSDGDNSKLNLRSVSESFNGTEDNKLLVPTKVLEVNVIQESPQAERIKKIEKEIARCKSVIAKLDELEVDDDSVNSPYIRSEKLKAKIVSLYRELCELTGSSPVKKRQIHLKVVEGHPDGPVRCLEAFLNDNIGSDGDPPFPDFSDVVQCVSEANEKDKLGWTRPEILREARVLFTQCGRALQKRRQNREWQDLLHKVKLERCDTDPADSDPALLQRLEDNRRAAVKKESEILERYTMMQTAPSTAVSNQTQDFIKCDEDVDSCNETDVSRDISSCQEKPEDGDTSTSLQNSRIIDDLNKDEIKIKKEPEEEIEERLGELGDNYTLSIIEIENDPRVIIEISDSSGDEGS